MNLRLLNFLLGYSILRAEGIYAERILNIAKEEGIFISDIEKDSELSIRFSVSSKGAKKLFSSSLPSDISLSLVSEKGLLTFFKRTKSRWLIAIAPILSLILLFLSTQVIWNVNIIGDDRYMEEKLLNKLYELGVKRGALKFTIDQSHIKNQILIDNNELLWVWVDLKGGGAIVKYALRDLPPKVFDENDHFNIYSTHDAIITKIITTEGTALVSTGDVVMKGQLLIEGSRLISEEETAPAHASGEVYGMVWEEKTVVFPKKEEIRTPTGLKKQHLTVNFLNFPIKLFINSSILYPEYDIIDYSREIPFLPLSFNKKEYREVTVTYKENNIDLIKKSYEEQFRNELNQRGFFADTIETYLTDEGDSFTLTLRSLCEEPIAVERRINIGENYSD